MFAFIIIFAIVFLIGVFIMLQNLFYIVYLSVLVLRLSQLILCIILIE